MGSQLVGRTVLHLGAGSAGPPDQVLRDSTVHGLGRGLFVVM